MTLRRSHAPISIAIASSLYAAAGDSGRDANIRIRLTPQPPPPIRSGPYPPGQALPERKTEGGVEIAGPVIKQEHYDRLRKAGFVPMRRELTDDELLAALKPELRAQIRSIADLASHSRHKFRDYIPFLFWGFRRRGQEPVWKAEETYRQHFTEDGRLKLSYFAWGAPPNVGMLRWGGSYWSTGEGRWARAVRDGLMPFYHFNRPPLKKVYNTKVSGMWHVLSAGASTPFLVEAYAYCHDSPDWSDEDHASFYKAMLERARFLRYTTVPVGPWLEFNPFIYGNILLYQLQGLLAIAAHFPEFTEADDWLQHATFGIGQHGDWTVMPDSGFDEYSYSYASQVAGQLEYCYNTFVKHGLPLPPRFETNVKRLHELFLKIATPGRHRIPFGDTHRGGDMGSSRCRWASLAFLDGRFKHFTGETSDEYVEVGARVLHPGDPAEAVQRYRSLKPVAPTALSHILPEPGWAVMRSSWAPDATVVALAYRASARVYHSGWEMLGINIWSHGEPLLTKLLGFKSYTTGYPKGFCRTPRQANAVIVKRAKMRRVSGSLRNWYSSDALDYLHADHRGWDDGRITARRRVLFIKPHWIVIVDDIEGEGAADLLWQAHAEELRPHLEGSVVSVTSHAARAAATFLDAAPAIETHRVEGMDKSVYLITAAKNGPSPLRFVVAIHVSGPGHPHHVTLDEGGLKLAANPSTVHTVSWEPVGSQGSRFLVCTSPYGSFFASDGNSSPALGGLVRAHRAEKQWNGRAMLVTHESAERLDRSPAIKLDSVQAFAYHGRPEMTAAGVAGRVVWHTEERARHSVLYRPKGTATWLRQFQPGLHRIAWILLPDLEPATDYELRVVSELESGTIARSPIFTRRSPGKWSMF